MVDLPTIQDPSSRPAEQVEGSWQGRFYCNISKKGDNAWEVGATVCNGMSFLVKMVEGKLKVGDCWTTLMEPGPELSKLEDEVKDIFKSLVTWRREGDDLVLVHGTGEEKLATVKPSPEEDF